MNRIESSYIFNRPTDPGFNPSNQFPGSQFGANIDQIRALINRGKCSKGFIIPVLVGTQEFSLKLPSDARILLGFCIGIFTAGETFSLQVNQEKIVDGAPVSCFTNLNRVLVDEYYVYPRPLSGQDEILFTYTAVGAKDQQLIFYYLQ